MWGVDDMRFVGIVGVGIFLVSCSATVSPVAKDLKNGGFTQEKGTTEGKAQPPGESADQVQEKKDPAETTASVDPNIMNLDEAKEKCASCHQPGGSGSSVWNTANGTEEDWKNIAVEARAAVDANTMPPPSGLTEPDKGRMIAYLQKLIEEASEATPTPTPTPVSYNFDTAKALCVDCHGKNQKSPRLTRTDDWRGKDRKKKLIKVIENGSMPKGKKLSPAERDALIEFVKSF